MANLTLPDNSQPYKRLHAPNDHWSAGDKAFLISSVGLGALLAAVGTLGILGHFGYNVGPFNVLSSKLGITPYALGAFGGGALLLTATAVASVKCYKDHQETKDVINTLKTFGKDHDDAINGRTRLHMKNLTRESNGYFTRGVFQRYHVLYCEENVYVFASKDGCDRQAANFVARRKQEDSDPPLQYQAAPDTQASVMEHNLYRTVYDRKIVKEDKTIEKKVKQAGKWVWIEQTVQVDKVIYDPLEVKETVRERIPFDRLRLGAAITLTALSIASIILPIFLRFKMGYALQMFGIGSTAVMLYGAVAGLLLAKRSDELVKKGHDSSFRRISKSDSKYLNGLGWGVSRAIFMAFLAGGLMAAAGCAIHKYSINPLFVAPPLALGAIALLAYTHFKGRERKEAWDDGCSIDMKKTYDSNPVLPERANITKPEDAQWFVGTRLIKTRDGKTLLCDLTEIKNRTAFEGAKRQYDLSTYLLPLLALILITALVGTRLFLWKCPLPKPV